MNEDLTHNTHDLGSLFVVFMRTTGDAPLVSRSPSWEQEKPFRFARTYVLRLWPLRFAVGVGWWRSSDVVSLQREHLRRVERELAQAEYDRFVAISGPVDREAFDAALREVQWTDDPEVRIEALQKALVDPESERHYWDNHTSDGRCKYPKTCEVEGAHAG